MTAALAESFPDLSKAGTARQVSSSTGTSETRDIQMTVAQAAAFTPRCAGFQKPTGEAAGRCPSLPGARWRLYIEADEPGERCSEDRY